ncbi:MAG: glycosyltransferase family 4 protein [Bacteroidota bacterium]
MSKAIRIIFCWSDISGYMAACWKALSAQPQVELRIFAFGNNQETDFNFKLTEGLDIHWVDRDPDSKELQSQVSEFKPDVIILCGWFVPAYRQIATVPTLQNKVKFILAMDTPWWGTWRQQIGRIALKSFIRKMDAVITSGERSYQYASRLGAKNIAKIQYGVDVSSLQQHLEIRKRNPWPNRFLFVGRYAEEKGIRLLMAAYQTYRENTDAPWELITCGKGPLEFLITGEGVINLGFVQPNEMDKVWQQAGCLVLPSSFDPWPLIVVEACAAGLPVICTHESGSQVEVVKMFWNGLVIPANSQESLVEALLYMDNHIEELSTWGDRSFEQARPYSSKIWADKIIQLIESF